MLKLDQEVGILTQVKHRNIITLNHSEMAPDRTSFTILFGHVEGHTLCDILHRGIQFSAAEVVDAAIDVLDGLSRIHSIGAVHRDVGSATVMKAQDDSEKSVRYIIIDSELVTMKENHATEIDVAYLALQSAIEGRDYEALERFHQAIDFHSNLNHASPDDVRASAFIPNETKISGLEMPVERTQHGEIWLPECMAPELWPHINAAFPRVFDERVDLWSCGVLLFHMTAGKLPFLPMAHIRSAVKPPSSAADDHRKRFYSRQAVNELRAMICSDEKSPDILKMIDRSSTRFSTAGDSKRATLNPNFCDCLMTFLEKKPENRPKSALVMKAKLQDVYVQSQTPATEHHIFISYRQVSEKPFAKLLYQSLNNTRTKGGVQVKVFLDQFDLKNGKEWEQAFAKGLFKSKIYMPILSAGFTGPMAGKDLNAAYRAKGGPKRLLVFRRDGYFRIFTSFLCKLREVATRMFPDGFFGLILEVEEDHQGTDLTN